MNPLPALAPYGGAPGPEPCGQHLPLVTWCYCLNTSVTFYTFYPHMVLTGLLVSPGMSLPVLPVISAPIGIYEAVEATVLS